MSNDDTLEELEERHDDIPDEDEMLESMKNPESHRRMGSIQLVKTYGQKLFKAALVSGGLLTVYLLLVKLPLAVLRIDGIFIASVTDPVLAVLVGVFGLLWTAVGATHLWGAWSFYRLRQIQNTSTRRAITHGLRGGIVCLTGIGFIGVAVLYGAFIFSA